MAQAPAVVAEHELVEIGIDVLASKAVVGAERPALHERLALPLTHDDADAAIAVLIGDKATVAAVLFVIGGLHIAAHIHAIDFHLAGRLDPTAASRAVKEYLVTLNEAAFGAATEVQPKFVSPSDPAAQWTGALKGPAFFAYADNYLIDVQYGVILDVEASRAVRQAEVGAARTMIERTEARFGLKPQRLAGDTAYGAAPMLNWLVEEKRIAPHIPVFDRSKREDGTFSREDFRYDEGTDTYVCPAGKRLTTTGWINTGDAIFYRSSVPDCAKCNLKARCCPKTPQRRVPRSIYERARDVARSLAGTDAFEQSRRERKRIEMRFAHLKRILRLGRLRLRGPRGARDEFTLAAIAQNLRRMAKLIAPITAS